MEEQIETGTGSNSELIEPLGAMPGIGGLMPTIFDLGDMWRLNAPRAGGRFNLIFGWWMSVIAFFVLIPSTVLALCELWLMTKEQKAQHIDKWMSP